MVSPDIKQFDTLVVGGGIAGLQAALDLGDQGYTVAVVEKDVASFQDGGVALAAPQGKG